MKRPAVDAEWLAKFGDMPVVRVLSAECPADDGDIAALNELADAIFDRKPSRLQWLPEGFLYRQTKDMTWIDPQRPWRTHG